MNTNKLMEMYKSTFQPALEEGVYKVKMLSHTPVEKEGQSPYIRFEFEVTEGASKGRKLSENRFEAGFGVLVSHLRQQLGRENEAVVPTELFDELIKNGTEFNIWIVKRIINGRQRTNFNFIKPIEEAKPNTEVVDDEIASETPVVKESADIVDSTADAQA